MKRTATIFIALALASCTNVRPFPDISQNTATTTTRMPVKASVSPVKRRSVPPKETATKELIDCVSLSCRTLCSKHNRVHKPKWCTYFKHPD